MTATVHTFPHPVELFAGSPRTPLGPWFASVVELVLA
ncbi:hypothetical protein ABIC61_000886 [Curtobacterium sp. 1544]